MNRQDESPAIGSPLLPVMADIYIEYFDEKVLETAPLKLTVRLRYVDNTFLT